MTIAAKDSPGAGGGPGIKRVLRHGTGAGGEAWKRLWQVPLLVAGLVGFGLGVRALVRTIRPVPFEAQVKGVKGLLAGGGYGKAIDQINILGAYYKDAKQQGMLQALAGDAHYLAEKQQLAEGSVLVPTNYERMEEHYSKAVAWGLEPTVEMNERWGEGALALGEAKVAAEKLEGAIAAASEEERAGLIRKHGREMVAAYLAAGARGRALEMMDRLLEAGGKGDDGGEKGNNVGALEAMEEKTWGLCTRIEIALAGGDPAAIKKAVEGARAGVEGIEQKDAAGRILGWIGRAELDQGDTEGAERDLTEARARFAVHHLDDARAAVLLARIAQMRGDLAKAEGLYQDVVKRQAGTAVWAAARLGVAEIASIKGERPGGGAGEKWADYRFAMAAARDLGKGKAPVGKAAELITPQGVAGSLEAGFVRAKTAGRLDDALMFLALEQQMVEGETAEMAYQLATTKEKRGEELLAEARRKEEGSEQVRQEAAGRAMIIEAAEAYQRHAKLVTLDDEKSGTSLWKAAELLDQAGATMRAAAVYERLTIQRPRDQRVPDGMLALGRLYESAGMLEKALAAYERNIKENAKTPAAYASAVHAAHCHELLGEQAEEAEEREKEFGKAEAALLALVQDDTDLRPEAREFRESLEALGELYYQSGRWSGAILRLEEFVTRYPMDGGVAHALFLEGESYRKSAGEIGEVLKKDPAMQGRVELEAARMERLGRAAEAFTRVIGLLDAAATGEKPGAANGGVAKKITALEEAYLKKSYMDRAECFFDRGDFEQAIKLYDQAAARFSEDVAAVDAYVQIVNAYLAMKQPGQASAASERGRWILKRVPEQAFAHAEAGREHYERLLALGKVDGN